jgi:hypothetical protein
MNSNQKKNNKKNIIINNDEKVSTSNKNIFIKEENKKNSEKKNSEKKEIKLDSNKYKKNGFERPEITYTDQLSKEEIQEKLADYSKVEDIYKVPLGVHLRYFVKKDGQMLFRMGGQLFKNNGLPEYVILKSGTNAQWSVQIKDTVFYRKMTLAEIKEEYEDIIKKKNEKIQALKEKLKKYEK